MIRPIACPHCGQQVNEAKIQTNAETIRCPECSGSIDLVKDNPNVTYVGGVSQDPHQRREDLSERPRVPSTQQEAENFQREPVEAKMLHLMIVGGGVVALVVAFGWIASIWGLLWVPWIYSFILGIVAIVKGVKLFRGGRGAPRAIAVMQMVNIINGDVINLILGIVELVLLGKPEVKAYYREQR